MTAHFETLLIVEDDAQIRNFIAYALKQEGFAYHTASAAQQAMEILISQKIDLMILDLGLPDFDGMVVIDRVRSWSEMPPLVVSARDEDKGTAAALDAGADDYLTKPFSATELMARIRVMIRHLHKMTRTQEQPVLSVGELSMDMEKRQVFLKGETLHLTPLEYNLLNYFFRNMGKVLTTQAIMREIYGVACGTDTQALRALMAGLRRKIEPVPAKPRYILTEIGVGYRLVDE